MVLKLVKEKLAGIKRKKRVAGCIAVILVIAIAAGVFLRGGSRNGQAVEVSVQSAAAEKGNISTTITGTGALENGDSEDVVVPAGIKVEKVLVESGDTVARGQQLATLDEVSVAEKLLEVKESLGDIEDEIDDLSSDADDSSTKEYLKAKVLNGKKKELKEAETKLKKLLKSKKITASRDGVISGVYVKDGSTVSQSEGSEESSSGTNESGGDFSVKSTNKSGNSNIVFLSANITHSESSSGSESSAGSKSGDNGTSAGGKASDSGTNTGNEASDAGTSAGSESGDSGTSAGDESSDSGTSAGSESGDSGTNAGNEASDSGTNTGGEASDSGTNTGGETGDNGANAGGDTGSSGTAEKIKIKECRIDVTAPVAGAKPQTGIGNAEYFTGTISWDCSAKTFQEDTSYTATINLTAKTGYEFSENIQPDVKGADVTSKVLRSDDGKSILRIQAKFPKTGKSPAGQGQGSNQGQGNKAAGAVSGGISARGGTGGSSISVSGSTGTNSSETENSEYKTPVFSIAQQDKTSVSINVDELDILDVKEGQNAEITLDALEGQSFQGTITNISQAASGSGSTKYPVEITLERTEDMRVGMSASATIYIDEANDVVLIPVNALQETGEKTFVYTQRDRNGNLSGEKEVTTGLSDGERAEVTSGLSEGDTVYYLRTGSKDGESGQQFPGMDGMPGGGNFPGGQGFSPDGQGFPGSGGNRPRGGNREDSK